MALRSVGAAVASSTLTAVAGFAALLVASHNGLRSMGIVACIGLITTPVVLPVMAALHIHPVWYGILLTINLELALITPPVGMNLFALKAIRR